MKRATVFAVLTWGMFWSLEAAARVGGGQGYSGGGGSGGGGYGGGGGGGDIDISLLIWLLIEYPQIGIPLLLIGGGAYLYVNYSGGFVSDQRYTSHRPTERFTTEIPGRGALASRDPNFSMPLFIDYAQLVYAKGQQLRPGQDTETLSPYFSARALKQLRANGATVEAVEDVIFGATQVRAFQIQDPWVTALVRYETNLTEVRGGDRVQLLCAEQWRFRRRIDVLSPGPATMRTLDCPNCGSPLEPDTDGRCPNCGTVRVNGQIQWEVVSLESVDRRPLRPPELHLGGGIEPGYNTPTLKDPDLGTQLREFIARHPDHDWDAFQARTREIFHKLQQAWSDQDWHHARPYQTDALFQVHRFWIERYQKFKLTNKLQDVEVLRTELVKVQVDAFLESATLRIYARMRDWTEDRGGKVVAGSMKDPRTFSEYWTFIRAVGAEPPEPDAWAEDRCPSCGAPLDHVSMAGVCGYCDAKITGGDYDWVLSRIEQDEAYAG